MTRSDSLSPLLAAMGAMTLSPCVVIDNFYRDFGRHFVYDLDTFRETLGADR
jgi:hypothetical protein